MTTFKFVNGRSYSRNEVLALLGMNPVPKWGPYVNGYFSYKGAYFIFCNVGVAGRTGHDYPNRFDKEDLIWTGKTGAKATHESIERMVKPGAEVHIFFRENNAEPFTYIGLGQPASIDDTVPVEIRWTFAAQGHEDNLPDEDQDKVDSRIEGGSTEVIARRYERNPSARAQCIKHYGHRCQVCGVDFGEVYGPWGEGFIHVHHHTPISTTNGQYTIDPIRDLIPVCPNCHAMLHRKKDVITVDKLKGLLQESPKAK